LSLYFNFSNELINLYKKVPSQFANSTFLQAVAGQPYGIVCNTTANHNITWIQTINSTGVYTVSNSSNVFISNNRLFLNFSSAQFVNQEYYACAYYGSNSLLNVIQAYFLYVKVYPTLSFVVGNTIYNQSNTIVLNAPGKYQMACLAVDAKPDVNLEIYDSLTFESLGNSSNSQLTQSCDSNNLCNVVLQINFALTAGSPFLTTTSITCRATSMMPQVNLDTSIVRSVNILYQNQTTVPAAFGNATSLIATALSNFTIVCNTTVSATITWIQTVNNTNQYFVLFNSRVYTSNNGMNLNIASVELVDQEYYACIYPNSNGTYTVADAYFLYVKGNNLNFIF